MFNSIREARIELIRSVARFCAEATLTEPAAKGDLAWEDNAPYLETKFVDDPQMLLRLADWMKQYGREHRQPIWLQEAALIERLDAVLFVGLKHGSEPMLDCGACGFATCAEFVEATRRRLVVHEEAFDFGGPQCTLRGITLGIVIASTIEVARLHGLATHCDTHIAIAARKLGFIEAEVAIAMTMTQPEPGFDDAVIPGFAINDRRQ
jgi:uncharacterized ferredoxin-like protein